MHVEHIKVNAKGMTRLLVAFPVGQRQGLAELSSRLGMSQQSLIRSAVARLLEDNRPEPHREAKAGHTATSEDGAARPPQPSPNHSWVATKGGGGYWRARRSGKKPG